MTANGQGQDAMRPECDFDYSTAVRGKYYGRLLRTGANVGERGPEVAARALRSDTAADDPIAPPPDGMRESGPPRP